MRTFSHHGENTLRKTLFFFALHRGGEAAFYGVSKGDTSSFN